MPEGGASGARPVAGLLVLGMWLLSASAWADEKVEGILRLQDALTSPGTEVTIEARLVRPTALRESGLGGETLQLLVRGKPVATAMTGGDGRARFQFAPTMRGTFPMAVRVLSSPRVRSEEALGTLASWERRRPILLVELLSLAKPAPPTTSPVPGLPIFLGDGADLEPAAEAQDELGRLTRYYFNVLYLQRGGRPAVGEHGDPREWLRRHEFPPGVLRAIPAGDEALTAFLEDMSESGWPNIKAAIGATAEFAEVLVEQRVHTVILPASEEDRELPRRARAVETWKGVRKEISR